MNAPGQRASDHPSSLVRAQEALRWLAVPLLGGLALPIVQAMGASVSVAPIASYALSFGCVCALSLGTAVLSPAWFRGSPELSRRHRALALAVGTAAALCIGLVAWTGSGGPMQAAWVLASLLLLGSLVGGVVGAAIEQPGHLLFVAIVSSIADAVSVLHPSGPSAAIAASEQALSLLALPFALLGTDATPPLLGVGDGVFAALYVASGRRHRLPRGRTLSALALGFLVTMVVVIGTELPVPALPFLGAAMLIAHPEARKPPARDRVRGFAALGVLFLVALALFALKLNG